MVIVITVNIITTGVIMSSEKMARNRWTRLASIVFVMWAYAVRHIKISYVACVPSLPIIMIIVITVIIITTGVIMSSEKMARNWVMMSNRWTRLALIVFVMWANAVRHIKISYVACVPATSNHHDYCYYCHYLR